MTEEWRAVPGAIGYEVSSTGLVRVWSRRRPDARRLKPTKTVKGYLRVAIKTEARTKLLFVHALVLTAFVGPRPPGLVTRHLNGVRDDNRLENLAWGTYAENAADTIAHGRSHRGELHRCAKLTTADVLEIRASSDTIPVLADRFGVSMSTIGSLRVRKPSKWAWLPARTSVATNNGPVVTDGRCPACRAELAYDRRRARRIYCNDACRETAARARVAQQLAEAA